MAIPRNLANLANQLDTSGNPPKVQVGDSSVVVTDTGSNGTITFTTDNTERARITNGGALLINTTTNDNAANRLYTIGYQGYASSATNLASSATKASARICGSTDSSQSSFMGALANGNGQYIQVANTSGTASYVLSLNPYGGNVGIGTDTPTDTASFGKAVDLSGAAGSAYYSRTNASGTDYALFGHSGTTAYLWNISNGVLTFATNNTERARITSGGYFKASYNGTYDNSTGTYHEFTGNAASNSALFIYNNNASFTNYVTEIYSNRNTTNATYYFLRCRVASVGDRLYIADSGNVTNVNGTYGTISDVKLKQDITDATSQWDDIKNLRFRKYRLRSEVEVNPDAKSLLGLVAQEAELVSPGLIEEHKDLEEIQVPVLDEDGNPVLDEKGNPKTEKQSRPTGTITKSIKTSILYMKAVKALQEAQLRIETLETQNAAFEARLAALEAK